ncbi:MAG: type I-MYXAN CRISPR-associated protein Cas6/Cmx6 [Gammaproteobacteria bacterium]|nr:type I-MYXAN CRISPR-associated protein Cas6/Cmx6 [Gammaproteobacteria bacterium]
MYWQEEVNEQQFIVPEKVVDLVFQIDCATLPVDHAWVLLQEIRRALPWFGDAPSEGLHIIHGADSGNGWERPQAADDLLYLSRRVKLVLRLPSERVGQAQALTGEILKPGGHSVAVGKSKVRKLGMTNFLYSRYVAGPENVAEDEFIEWAVKELRALGLSFKKILCGKSCLLDTNHAPLETHSLLVANLPFEDAVTLQESGLGPHRSMGCGLFIPQKSF